jgi:predicted Zn-dependent peptidase
LFQSLIKEQQLFSEVNAFISGDMDAGLLTVTGRLMPGVEMADAEAAIWKELLAMASTEVDARELLKVKNKIESNLVFSEISFLNKAMNMAQYEMMGDVNEINREIEYYRSVTTAEIQQAAARIFRKENSCTLRYLGKSEG